MTTSGENSTSGPTSDERAWPAGGGRRQQRRRPRRQDTAGTERVRVTVLRLCGHSAATLRTGATGNAVQLSVDGRFAMTAYQKLYLCF